MMTRVALPSALVVLTLLAAPPAQDYTVQSATPQSGAFFGNSLSIAGDIDGDGLPELIVGSPGFNKDLNGDMSAEGDVGRVEILSGADRSVLFVLDGSHAGEQFGFAVAGGGDFDADGVPDFAVGTPNHTASGVVFAGGAWVFSGADASVLYSVEGTAINGFVGRSVAFVGNIPRDETFGPDVYDDVAIGAPASSGPRRVIVAGLRATPTGPAITVSQITPPSGGNASSGFGQSVGGLDFNADGVPDVAVGSPFATSVENFAGRGRAYVFSGVDLASQLFFRDGKQNNGQQYGSSVASAGDFDGVPGDELIVGSRQYRPISGISSAGAVDVYAYALGTTLGTPLLHIEGSESNMQLGSAVAGIGDVDGDGFDDILSGQAGPTSSFPGGNAYVLTGGATFASGEVATSPRVFFRVTDEVTVGIGDSMGIAVAGGRDVNGDGRSEWLVGAPNRAGVGQVLSFSNAPSVDPATSTITAEPTIVSAFGGLSLITVTPKDAAGVNTGPGSTVALSTSAGTFVDAIMDHGDGTYTRELQGSGSAGTAIVSATVDGVALANTASVTFVAIDPNQSTVAVSAVTSFLDANLTVTVTPRDDLGQVIGAGLAVVIDATIGTLVGAVIDQGDGTYTQAYQATALGTADITATVEGLPLAASATVTVIDPGAIGSVVGSDAGGAFFGYASIQDAVNNAVVDGLVQISVPPGVYAENIKIDEITNLSIEGLSATNPVVISGFRIVDSAAISNYLTIDATLTDRDGIRITGKNQASSGVVIFGCHITGAGEGHSGVAVDGGNGAVRIDTCLIELNGNDGIELDKSGGPYTIVDCVIDANGYNGISAGADVEVAIIGNIITNNGTRAGNGGGRYGLCRRRDNSGGNPLLITLIRNAFAGNHGQPAAGRSDPDIKNFDQVIDATDDQPGYTP